MYIRPRAPTSKRKEAAASMIAAAALSGLGGFGASLMRNANNEQQQWSADGKSDASGIQLGNSNSSNSNGTDMNSRNAALYTNNKPTPLSTSHSEASVSSLLGMNLGYTSGGLPRVDGGQSSDSSLFAFSGIMVDGNAMNATVPTPGRFVSPSTGLALSSESNPSGSSTQKRASFFVEVEEEDHGGGGLRPTNKKARSEEDAGLLLDLTKKQN